MAGLFYFMNPYWVHAKAFGLLQKSIGHDGDKCPQITWGGVAYNIVPRSAVLKQDLAIGGFSPVFTLRFTARVADFANGTTIQTIDDVCEAMLNRQIVYQGENYKVTSASAEPGGFLFTVEANALNEGAGA